MKTIFSLFVCAFGLGLSQVSCNQRGAKDVAPVSAKQDHQVTGIPSPTQTGSPFENRHTGGASIQEAKEQAEFQRRCDRAPIGDGVASPTTGDAPLTVKFDGSKSVDPNKTKITKWQWFFGDGASGDGKVVAHTYDKPGVYAVSLNVTDSQGETTKDCYDATTSLKIAVTGDNN